MISLALIGVLALAPPDVRSQSPTADSIFAHARQIAEQGDSRPALLEFDRALAIYRSHHDRRGEAITLNAIGNTYEDRGDYDKALDYLQRALAIKQELGDRLEIGKTLSNMGLVYWDRADYAKATDHYNRSLEIARAVKDQKLEGSVLNNLGLVYDDQGEYPRSLGYYQQALQIHRAIHFEQGENDVLGNLGGWHSLLGRYGEAIPYYEQALEIDERLKVKRQASLDLGNIAVCQAGLGQLDEALRTCNRALLLAREGGAKKDEADWHKGKGATYASKGKYDLAREEYRQALAIYEAAGLKRELIEGLEDDGNLHELLGDSATAEKDFRRGLEFARSIGNPRGVTAGMMALGDLEWRRKRFEPAAVLYQEAYGRAKEADDRGTMAASLTALSFALRDEGKPDAALPKVQEALEIAHATGATLAEAKALLALGELARRSNDAKKSFENFSAGLDLALTAGDTDLEWQLAYGKGQALESLERNEDALVAYKQSVGVIEGVRAQLHEERFQAGYLEDKYQVYVALVRLLLKMGKTGQAFQYSEKLRARSYLDMLDRYHAPAWNPTESELRARIRRLQRAVELEEITPPPERRGGKLSAFSSDLSAAEREYQTLLDDLRNTQPDYGSARALAVPSTEQMQTALPVGAALVEYIVGDDTLSIFVLTRTDLHAKTVPVRSIDLRAKVELFRDLIARGGSRDWVKPGESLDRLLIEPVEKEGWLKDVTKILLAPHSVLHYLPFAALPRPDSQGSHFLVQDYVLGYLPAASALVHAKDLPSPAGSLLAMAPVSSRLRYAPQEARSVGSLYPVQSLVLVGQGATKDAFERQAGGFTIIHLAAHGYFDRFNPMFSGVDLEPEKQDDGRLQVYEILRMHLHAQLVTLSACETAMGSGYFSEYPAGDDIVGLTRAFLYAGSRSVMASLWEVNDRSTLDFMRSFYGDLQKTDEAAALRQAQLAMIESHGRYSPPYFWAPFILIGINK